MDSMSMKPDNEIDLKIAGKAAEWLYRLEEEENADCRPDFLAWLKNSPRHMHEFLMMTAVSRELDAIDPERRLDAQELKSQAFINLVSLRESVPSVTEIQRSPSFRSRRLKAIAASGVIFVTSAVLVIYWRASPTYSTAIGEQRTVKLQD